MDRTGAFVVGAPIRISSALANFAENAETDQTGRFSLKLTPGKYNIFVSAFGFAAWGRCAEIKPESRTIDIVLPIAEKTSQLDMGGPSFPPLVMNTPSSTASARTSVVIEVKDMSRMHFRMQVSAWKATKQHVFRRKR